MLRDSRTTKRTQDGRRGKVVEEEMSSTFQEQNITKCITLTDNRYGLSMMSRYF